MKHGKIQSYEKKGTIVWYTSNQECIEMHELNLSKYKLLAPLYLWILYSVATILIFEFGPFQFPVQNKLQLYLYLFGAHVSIILGYYSGFKKFRNIKEEKVKSKFISKKMLNVIAFIVFLGVVIAFARDYFAGMSIASSLKDSFGAREAYTSIRSGGILGYLEVLFRLGTVPYLAIGIINFKSLNKFSSFVLFLLIFRVIYEAILGSSRSGLLMLITVLFFSLLAIKFNNSIKISFKKLLLIATIILTLFASYVAYISAYRQVKPIENYEVYMSQNSKYTYDANSIFNPKFSGDYQLLNTGIYTGYFYLVHGYKGLSEAINTPFLGTTLFFGHSDFSIRNLARLFGEDVLNYSYFHRLVNENIYPATNFITAYAWIASDTTFIGSFFLLYFFGSLFSKSWIRVLKSPTIASSALLAWMAFFFFQINMTFVGTDLGAFFSFWGAILLYKFKLKTHG